MTRLFSFAALAAAFGAGMSALFAPQCWLRPGISAHPASPGRRPSGVAAARRAKRRRLARKGNA